ncbi:hypothetical protein [Dactylosporangium sp. NPDC006015]|uniref:hypothetical protein n=1 Tax=Dactylosporangium sp. NPDC006015 TaxID=3154576 RepID=UPI0033A2D70C
MTRWEKFDDVDAVLPPSPFEEFDVEFDAALVRRGDVHADGDFTGGDLYRMAGVGSTDELTAFVIDGDLTVGGTLDLDEGAPETFALMVTGTLRAAVVSVDATMLYVYGGAVVSRLIHFATTDGTLAIGGTTDCPLTVYDDGNLEVDSTGLVLNRRFGETSPDLVDGLVDGLVRDDGRVDDRLALAWARDGKPLLRRR